MSDGHAPDGAALGSSAASVDVVAATGAPLVSGAEGPALAAAAAGTALGPGAEGAGGAVGLGEIATRITAAAADAAKTSGKRYRGLDPDTIACYRSALRDELPRRAGGTPAQPEER